MVATPGRLKDFCDKAFITFENLQYFVLDEADRMLDMGFAPAVDEIMRNPTMVKTGKRQTLMFSATFPNDIQRLAGKYLHEYIFLTVGIVGGACQDVEQNIYQIGKFEKRNKLMEILNSEDPRGTMVFVETKRTADFLASFLSESEHPTTSIHGDRRQSQREEALADFKTGKMKVIIATSVAARGLGMYSVYSSAFFLNFNRLIVMTNLNRFFFRSFQISQRFVMSSIMTSLKVLMIMCIVLVVPVVLEMLVKQHHFSMQNK